MKQIFHIFFIMFIVTHSMSLRADQVQQKNESHILAIQEYRVVSSSNDKGNLARTIAVVVRNKTGGFLHHVYLRLDSKPAHVTGSGSLYFPELAPGETRESNNTIEIIVDTSQQTTTDLELVWQIETEIDGEKIIDEIAVSEIIK